MYCVLYIGICLTLKILIFKNYLLNGHQLTHSYQGHWTCISFTLLSKRLLFHKSQILWYWDVTIILNLPFIRWCFYFVHIGNPILQITISDNLEDIKQLQIMNIFLSSMRNAIIIPSLCNSNVKLICINRNSPHYLRFFSIYLIAFKIKCCNNYGVCFCIIIQSLPSSESLIITKQKFLSIT